MFKIIVSKDFVRKYRKLTAKNKKLELKINKTFKFLMSNPYSQPLRTHKVNTRNYGKCFSSRVTGDLRIIWNYDKNKKLTIMALSIGGHSGGGRVYC